ncbi:MAG: hypothetical protein AAGI30_03510 [Planctomycetota bacterium]
MFVPSKNLLTLTVAGLLAGSIGAQTTVLEDGFGDGDRDNDGTANGFVSDGTDTGAAFWRSDGTSTITLGVIEDATLGGTNSSVLNLARTNNFARKATANFSAPVTLADGDSLTVSFRAKVSEVPFDPTDSGSLTDDGDAVLRFFVSNDGGTPVTMDNGSSAGSESDDDPGFEVRVDGGPAPTGTTALQTRTTAGGSITASVSSSTSPDATDVLLNDVVKTYSLDLTRNGDSITATVTVTGGSSTVMVSNSVDAARLATDGLDSYTFHNFTVGTNASVDFSVDDVLAVYTPAAPAPTVFADIFDGFGDGDRENDGSAVGVVTDAGDVGVPFFISDGTSSIALSVVDDPTLGGVNSSALNIARTGSTASRRISTVFNAPVTLADGDMLSVSLRARVSESPFDPTDGGSLIDDGNEILRFALTNDGGTPITGDVSSSTNSPSDDDAGVEVRVDAGPAQVGGTSSQIRTASGSIDASTSDANVLLSSTAKTYSLDLLRVGDGIVATFTATDGVNTVTASNTIDAATLIADGLGSYTFHNFTLIPTGSVDFNVDDVSVVFTPPPPPTAFSFFDGLGDGDRENDGSEIGFVSDATDVGGPIFISDGTAGIDLSVVEDSSLGGTNASVLNVERTDSNSRSINVNFPEPAVLQNGDSVSFSFIAVRTTPGGTANAEFDFGIFSSQGTPITGDVSSATNSPADDDVGIFSRIDVGDTIPDGPSFNLRWSGGSLGSATDPNALLNGTPKIYSMTLTRVGDTLEILSTVTNGGIVVTRTNSLSATDLAGQGLGFTFDTALIELGAAINHRIDDIRVLFQRPGVPLPLFDGFGDNDTNNDGIQNPNIGVPNPGMLEDINDFGARWVLNDNSNFFDVFIDNGTGGIGTGNAGTFFKEANETGTEVVSATFEDHTLENLGDFILLSFDARMVPPVVPSDKTFRWGLFNNGGTPASPGSSASLSDDTGYHINMDVATETTPDPAVNSVSTTRGDVTTKTVGPNAGQPDSFMGGSQTEGNRTLGATSNDPAFAITDVAKTFTLKISRGFSALRDREVNVVIHTVDGVQTTNPGVDVVEILDEMGMAPSVTEPLVFTFNQVSLALAGADTAAQELGFDNVSVTTGNETPFCDVDVNFDGSVDPFDLAEQFNAFATTDPNVDLPVGAIPVDYQDNGEVDVIDSVDVQIYLDGYAIGCSFLP